MNSWRNMEPRDGGLSNNIGSISLSCCAVLVAVSQPFQSVSSVDAEESWKFRAKNRQQQPQPLLALVRCLGSGQTLPGYSGLGAPTPIQGFITTPSFPHGTFQDYM